MELEFDKEINAILRKAGERTGAGVMAPASPHLDEDTIAAFAENALPDKARAPLLEHFADCDRCRKMLSQSVLLNAEADATAAFSVAVEPVAAKAVPWYQSIFRTPNLALAMGALVLAFSGVLVYFVLQNRDGGQNAVVSQVDEPAAKSGGPFYSGEPEVANSNASTQSAVSNPANTSVASNSAAKPENPTMSTPEGALRIVPGALGRVDSDEERSRSGMDDKNVEVTSGVPAKPAAPPPPVAEPVDVAKSELGEKKSDNDKFGERGKDLALAKRKENSEDRGGSYRDAPPAASKSGPARSGPLQSQSNQINNRAYDMPVTRVVGGRSFNNRGGVWYDTAYHGQATSNFRRGTDEYKKLDGGLRSIVNTLGGTVVIVWKAKAYRIQ
jgi:hypothetical protein